MTYELLIENKTQRKKRSPIAGSSSEGKDNSGGGSGTGGESGKGVNKDLAKGLIALNHYIKPFTDQIINQKATTVALRTGAQEAEERLSFKIQVGQKVYGLASSMITGALIGGGVGAAVDGVMSVLTTVVSYSNQSIKLNLQRGVEDIGLRYVNSRAGGSVASFSGSRLKNQ